MALQPKLAFALFLLLLLQACAEPPTEHHRILVIYDVTGSSAGSLPTSSKVLQDITSLVDVKAGPKDGYQIGFTRIDDVSGGQIKEVSIDADNTAPGMGNPKKRQREVKSFLDDTEQALASLLAGADQDKKYSKIYNKLCKSLRSHHQGSGPHYLLVYSDMLENSELASFYQSATLEQASEDPATFAEQQLEGDCKIGNLSDYQVALFPYRTTTNDTKVNKAEQFWRGLLESKGATVSIH